jgi:hypothetical protein
VLSEYPYFTALSLLDELRVAALEAEDRLPAPTPERSSGRRTCWRRSGGRSSLVDGHILSLRARICANLRCACHVWRCLNVMDIILLRTDGTSAAVIFPAVFRADAQAVHCSDALVYSSIDYYLDVGAFKTFEGSLNIQ